MCGIYCSNLSALKNSEGERLLRLRGPDYLSKIKIDDFYISHSLLSITGEITPQPLIKNDVVCLYNGEIYNHGEYGVYDSDGKALIDAYLRDGVTFTQNLDGEFALVLYDSIKRILIISTDTFATKPIYYSIESKNLGFSSYKTPLEEAGHINIKKLPANTTRIINLEKGTFLEYPVTTFNLDQYNTSFDQWITAFEESIQKRTKNCNKKIFIGLSSGYDSGAICNELIKQNINFKAYTVTGTEDENILTNRKSLVKESSTGEHGALFKTESNYLNAHNYIKENTENYKYNIDAANHPYDFWRGCDLIDDIGSNWLSLVCQRAQEEGYRVHLSGGGSDEIFSDYGFNGASYLPHSNFGGLFPEDLNTIYPWKNFYGGSMESYIMKEEYVGGAYGIETRYPFLDKKVVQEFLNLDKNTKNKNYKSIIYEYLIRHNYPFKPNVKLGF